MIMSSRCGTWLPIRLSLTSTCNCFVLLLERTNYSRILSSDHLLAGFLCSLLQPSSPLSLYHQLTHSMPSGVLATTPPATVSHSVCTPASTLPDGDSAWNAQLPHNPIFVKSINHLRKTIPIFSVLILPPSTTESSGHEFGPSGSQL